MQADQGFGALGFGCLGACEGKELLKQVAVTLYALLQQGGLLARFGGQLHIVEPLCLKGKGGHGTAQFVCGIGDKALLLADVFVCTLQQVVDGDDKALDFAGNVLRVHRREVVDLALFQIVGQGFDGTHGAVGNPDGEQDNQGQGEEHGEDALHSGHFGQLFAIVAFLHDGDAALLGITGINAVVIVVVIGLNGVQAV